jgi:hypothetical protein
MFVLERDPDGTVREAFTPDFYLPDLGLYLERTVLQPHLTYRKRRKLRKVRAQTGIAIEVLFGDDLRRLADRWALDELARAAQQQAAGGA